MRTYSIAKLKSNFSTVVAEAAKGAEVLITEHNRPLPRCNISRLLKGTPIKYTRRPKDSIAQLVRKLRDE